MADLALAFHWAPLVMDLMSIEELMCWWTKAHARMAQEPTDG